LWDIIIYEGKLSVHRIGLAIFHVCSEEIKCCQSMDTLVPFLLNLPKHKVDTQCILSAAYEMDVTKLMKKLNAMESIPPPPTINTSSKPSLLNQIFDSQQFGIRRALSKKQINSPALKESRGSFKFSFGFLHSHSTPNSNNSSNSTTPTLRSPSNNTSTNIKSTSSTQSIISPKQIMKSQIDSTLENQENLVKISIKGKPMLMKNQSIREFSISQFRLSRKTSIDTSENQSKTKSLNGSDKKLRTRVSKRKFITSSLNQNNTPTNNSPTNLNQNNTLPTSNSLPSLNQNSTLSLNLAKNSIPTTATQLNNKSPLIT
jgi:hypothetical protein